MVKNEIEDLPPQEEKPNTQKAPTHTSGRSKKQAQKDIYNERNNKPEVPDCDCFSSDKKPPEPGSYYTHLGKKRKKKKKSFGRKALKLLTKI